MMQSQESHTMSFPWFRMTLLGGGCECYFELANTEADRKWNPGANWTMLSLDAHDALHFAAPVMGLGYLLMNATVPTPEQTYAAMSPDLRRKVDANRAARLAQEQTIKRQIDAQSDPDAGKPIWANQPNQR